MSALHRRSFLRGLIAAPAVIRVAPLMRISAFPLVLPEVPDFVVGWREIHSRGDILLEWSDIDRAMQYAEQGGLTRVGVTAAQFERWRAACGYPTFPGLIASDAEV